MATRALVPAHIGDMTNAWFTECAECEDNSICARHARSVRFRGADAIAYAAAGYEPFRTSTWRPRMPDGTRAAVWQRDDGTCQICEEPVDPTDWHADHIIPWGMEGSTHEVHNLRVTHPACNINRSY